MKAELELERRGYPPRAYLRRVPFARGDSVSEHPRLHDPGKERRAASGIPIVGVLDGFRAIAIIGVVMFHVFQESGVFNAAGDSLAGSFSGASSRSALLGSS